MPSTKGSVTPRDGESTAASQYKSESTITRRDSPKHYDIFGKDIKGSIDSFVNEQREPEPNRESDLITEGEYDLYNYSIITEINPTPKKNTNDRGGLVCSSCVIF